MRERPTDRQSARDREFRAFVAGAAGRLLRTATLLTAEPPRAAPRARRLLTLALAHTYARWDRLRGDDPYNGARQFLVLRFAHGAWHSGWHDAWPGIRHAIRHRVPRGDGAAGVLGGLTPHQRVIVVLRLHEGVTEEQTAALLGLPVERVRAVCDRATALLLHPPRPRDEPQAQHEPHGHHKAHAQHKAREQHKSRAQHEGHEAQAAHAMTGPGPETRAGTPAIGAAPADEAARASGAASANPQEAMPS